MLHGRCVEIEIVIYRTVGKAFSLRRRWPEGPDVVVCEAAFSPTSVKNQRFLPASPQGEAFEVHSLNSTLNWNLKQEDPSVRCVPDGGVLVL